MKTYCQSLLVMVLLVVGRSTLCAHFTEFEGTIYSFHTLVFSVLGAGLKYVVCTFYYFVHTFTKFHRRLHKLEINIRCDHWGASKHISGGRACKYYNTKPRVGVNLRSLARVEAKMRLINGCSSVNGGSLASVRRSLLYCRILMWIFSFTVVRTDVIHVFKIFIG